MQIGSSPWPVEVRVKRAERRLEVDFDDGHSTGIYTWSYLHQLGREQDRLWSAYLEALKAKGLSR